MCRASLVVLATLGACTFAPRGELPGDGDAAAPPDGPATPDAAPCRLGAMPPLADGGVLGSTAGGDPLAPLTCPADQLPIGAAFDLTDNPISNHGNQRLVAGVHLRCAALTQAGSDVTVTPTDLDSLHGGTGGNCAAYRPFTTSPEARCPTGTVLVGFDGNQPDDVLFNHVALRCAPLGSPGTVGADVTIVPVDGTGTDSNRPQTATCPAGTMVIGLSPHAGCGIDGLVLTCAPLTCD
ncbi:MAG: hypothetical protein JNK64_18930 [Myxococcales bacterium]|nr:hypothetical protein [Myxococcales bacterium]